MSTANELNCCKCNNLIPIHIRIIKCDLCTTFFHVKCCGINHKTLNSIKQLNNIWNCDKCVKLISNSNEISTGNDITGSNLTIYNVISKKSNPKRKSKCGKCLKNMCDDFKCIRCDTCAMYFHVKCPGISKSDFL